METKELTPEQLIDRLHAFTPAEPFWWQVEEMAPYFPPESMVTGVRLSAGTLDYGDKSVSIDIVIPPEKLADYLSQRSSDVIEKQYLLAIATALQTLSRQQEGINCLVSICFLPEEQPINPNTNEPANAQHPASVLLQDKQGNLSNFTSGTIFIYPAALKLGPYRNQHENIPHLTGIILHESAHQYMTITRDNFGADWIAKIGWQEEDPSQDTWSYPANDLEQPISAYAATTPVEDFAESYLWYVLHPDELKTRCPKRYAFLEKRFPQEK